MVKTRGSGLGATEEGDSKEPGNAEGHRQRYEYVWKALASTEISVRYCRVSPSDIHHKCTLLTVTIE